MEWRRFVTYLSNDPRTKHILQSAKHISCSHFLYMVK